MGRLKQNTPYIAHREPMKIGYARVSTTKQDLSVQKDLLKKQVVTLLCLKKSAAVLQ